MLKPYIFLKTLAEFIFKLILVMCLLCLSPLMLILFLIALVCEDFSVEFKKNYDKILHSIS